MGGGWVVLVGVGGEGFGEGCSGEGVCQKDEVAMFSLFLKCSVV